MALASRLWGSQMQKRCIGDECSAEREEIPMRHTGLRIFVAASTLLAAAPVLAHTGMGDTNGFAHGFAHPLGGIDHVLAMVGAGIFAA